MAHEGGGYTKSKGPHRDTVFCQTLRAVRRSELLLTQAELAERLGCSTSVVSKWEAGLSYPALRYRPTLAALLRVNRAVLFGDMENRDA